MSRHSRRLSGGGARVPRTDRARVISVAGSGFLSSSSAIGKPARRDTDRRGKSEKISEIRLRRLGRIATGGAHLAGTRRLSSSNQFWTSVISVTGAGFLWSSFTIRNRSPSSERSYERMGWPRA